MKQQLHRSITFWSGILVMAFIGWAWADSAANWSKFEVGNNAVSNLSGGLVLEKGTDPSVCFPWSGRMDRPRNWEMPAFKGPHFERGGTRNMYADISAFHDKSPGGFSSSHTLGEIAAGLGLPQGPLDQAFGTMFYRPPGDWRLFIPHWIPLLAVVLAWSVLLLWRARRRKRVPVVD